MARRRKTDSDGGVNLDSLLDALTNVVAVLILVLVLVQMDVTRKVVDFLSKPVDLAEFQKLLRRVLSPASRKSSTEDAVDPKMVFVGAAASMRDSRPKARKTKNADSGVSTPSTAVAMAGHISSPSGVSETAVPPLRPMANNR